jgi:hypothetical protein
MMIIYGESGSNSKAVARLYRERFPHGQYPSSDIFLRLVNRSLVLWFPTEDELVVLTARFALLIQKESYFNNSRKMEREVLEMWLTS